MGKERIEVYSQMFKAAARSLKTEAEKVPEDKRLRQIADGKGHPLWHMGHLAHGQDLIINQWLLGGDSVVPAEYGAIFAPGIMGGKTPTPNADDYPAWDDVLENYDKACAKTFELLEGLSDEDLPGDLKGDVPEQARGFFGKLGESLIGMGLHETHHRGQIALICALND